MCEKFWTHACKFEQISLGLSEKFLVRDGVRLLYSEIAITLNDVVKQAEGVLEFSNFDDDGIAVWTNVTS